MKKYIKDAPRNIREEQKSLAEFYEFDFMEALGLTEEDLKKYLKENKRR